MVCSWEGLGQHISKGLDFRVGETLPCRYSFLISGDLNMSSHLFQRNLKYNSYSLNLNVCFLLSLQPPILLSVTVANVPAVFSLAANSVSYWNIVYAGAIYFLRDEKQIAKANYCQLVGMHSSSEHFNIIFELLFIILCWLVKYFSNNS